MDGGTGTRVVGDDEPATSSSLSFLLPIDPILADSALGPPFVDLSFPDGDWRSPNGEIVMFELVAAVMARNNQS